MIYPRENYVVLVENEPKKTTASGIILAETTSGDTRTATVTAVGPTVKETVVGQVVFALYQKGVTVTVDGKRYSMIKEDDIIAVVTDGE